MWGGDLPRFTESCPKKKRSFFNLKNKHFVKFHQSSFFFVWWKTQRNLGSGKEKKKRNNDKYFKCKEYIIIFKKIKRKN